MVEIPEGSLLGYLVACAYPERVAVRVQKGQMAPSRFKLASGEVRISGTCLLALLLVLCGLDIRMCSGLGWHLYMWCMMCAAVCGHCEAFVAFQKSVHACVCTSTTSSVAVCCRTKEALVRKVRHELLQEHAWASIPTRRITTRTGWQVCHLYRADYH